MVRRSDEGCLGRESKLIAAPEDRDGTAHGKYGVGRQVLSLFRTRVAQGDLLASEPKQAETEQAIALQMGLFQRPANPLP